MSSDFPSLWASNPFTCRKKCYRKDYKKEAGGSVTSFGKSACHKVSSVVLYAMLVLLTEGVRFLFNAIAYQFLMEFELVSGMTIVARFKVHSETSVTSRHKELHLRQKRLYHHLSWVMH
jgi:hypothetical protein